MKQSDRGTREPEELDTTSGIRGANSQADSWASQVARAVADPRAEGLPRTR